MTAPVWMPDRGELADSVDIEHVVCECSPDWAACGLDVSDLGWAAEASNLCALCALAVESGPCPRCGGDLVGDVS